MRLRVQPRRPRRHELVDGADFVESAPQGFRPRQRHPKFFRRQAPRGQLLEWRRGPRRIQEGVPVQRRRLRPEVPEIKESQQDPKVQPSARVSSMRDFAIEHAHGALLPKVVLQPHELQAAHRVVAPPVHVEKRGYVGFSLIQTFSADRRERVVQFPQPIGFGRVAALDVPPLVGQECDGGFPCFQPAKEGRAYENLPPWQGEIIIEPAVNQVDPRARIAGHGGKELPQLYRRGMVVRIGDKPHALAHGLRRGGDLQVPQDDRVQAPPRAKVRRVATMRAAVQFMAQEVAGHAEGRDQPAREKRLPRRRAESVVPEQRHGGLKVPLKKPNSQNHPGRGRQRNPNPEHPYQLPGVCLSRGLVASRESPRGSAADVDHALERLTEFPHGRAGRKQPDRGQRSGSQRRGSGRRRRGALQKVMEARRRRGQPCGKDGNDSPGEQRPAEFLAKSVDLVAREADGDHDASRGALVNGPQTAVDSPRAEARGRARGQRLESFLRALRLFRGDEDVRGLALRFVQLRRREEKPAAGEQRFEGRFFAGEDAQVGDSVVLDPFDLRRERDHGRAFGAQALLQTAGMKTAGDHHGGAGVQAAHRGRKVGAQARVPHLGLAVKVLERGKVAGQPRLLPGGERRVIVPFFRIELEIEQLPGQEKEPFPLNEQGFRGRFHQSGVARFFELRGFLQERFRVDLVRVQDVADVGVHGGVTGQVHLMAPAKRAEEAVESFIADPPRPVGDAPLHQLRHAGLFQAGRERLDEERALLFHLLEVQAGFRVGDLEEEGDVGSPRPDGPPQPPRMRRERDAALPVRQNVSVVRGQPAVQDRRALGLMRGGARGERRRFRGQAGRGAAVSVDVGAVTGRVVHAHEGGRGAFARHAGVDRARNPLVAQQEIRGAFHVLPVREPLKSRKVDAVERAFEGHELDRIPRDQRRKRGADVPLRVRVEVDVLDVDYGLAARAAARKSDPPHLALVERKGLQEPRVRAFEIFREALAQRRRKGGRRGPFGRGQALDERVGVGPRRARGQAGHESRGLLAGCFQAPAALGPNVFAFGKEGRHAGLEDNGGQEQGRKAGSNARHYLNITVDGRPRNAPSRKQGFMLVFRYEMQTAPGGIIRGSRAGGWKVKKGGYLHFSAISSRMGNGFTNY